MPVTSERRSLFERALAAPVPWSPVYGVARSLLALTTASTLALTGTGKLFSPAVGIENPPRCGSVVQAGLFCVARDHLSLARLLAVVVLLVVASGWRPRFTALPHWWLSWSVIAGVTVQDGGDQATAVLTLLLLPVALLDPRRWHWSVLDDGIRDLRPAGYAVSTLFVWLTAFQVAAIYFHSSVAKLGKADWVNGTAMYYWYEDRTFGFPGFARPAGRLLFDSGIGTVAVTWGVVALELAIALTGLFAARRLRHRLLAGGLLLHTGIGLLLGLGSFAIAMIAALLLLMVRPGELRLDFAYLPSRWRTEPDAPPPPGGDAESGEPTFDPTRRVPT